MAAADRGGDCINGHGLPHRQVVIWIGASFFLTYAKVSAAGVMRLVGRRALIWYGAATQLGGLLGAVTGFVLVDQLKVFKLSLIHI